MRRTTSRQVMAGPLPRDGGLVAPERGRSQLAIRSAVVAGGHGEPPFSPWPICGTPEPLSGDAHRGT